MLKIALSGKAKSGKNTVSDMIIKILKLCPSEFRADAFANPIKQMIQEMFPGCNTEGLYGSSELRQNQITSILDIYNVNTLPTTYRQASIDIGRLGRSYHPDFWVWRARMNFDKASANPALKAYIISDQRFPNEREWLKSEGFVLCRVARREAAKIDDISETIQDQQPDELFDFILDNNSTMIDLEKQVKEMIGKITLRV